MIDEIQFEDYDEDVIDTSDFDNDINESSNDTNVHKMSMEEFSYSLEQEKESFVKKKSNINYIGFEDSPSIEEVCSVRCFSWVEKTNIPCRNCHHTFENKPIGIVLNIVDIDGVINIFMHDYFCSWECYKYFITCDIDTERRSRRMRFFYETRKHFFVNNMTNVMSSFPINKLKLFGGCMDINEFRKNNKETFPDGLDLTKKNIKLWGVCGICSVSNTSEEKLKGKTLLYKEKINIKKEVATKTNILESIMGIKKK